MLQILRRRCRYRIRLSTVLLALVAITFALPMHVGAQQGSIANPHPLTATQICGALGRCPATLPIDSSEIANLALDGIAALQSFTGRPPVVVLRDQSMPNDGGGGTFVWVAGDTSADDGCTVFQPISAGAAGRYRRLFSGPLDVRWCGAKGDGETDNTAAFNRALAACDAMGGCELSVPAGFYLVSAQLRANLANKLEMVGAGRGNTVLQWTNASGGLSVTFADVTKAPSFRSLSLRTSYAGGGEALRIQAPTAGGVGVPGLIGGVDIQDLDIAPAGSGGYWSGGVHLLDAWYPSIRRFSYRGAEADGALTVLPFKSSFGVEYERTQALFMQDFTIFHVENGILQAGVTSGEGLNVSKFEMVGVRTGANLTSFTGGTLAIIGIHDGHINSYEAGIKLLNIAEGNFTGLLFIKTNLSRADYVGISNLNGYGNRISNNYFEDSQFASGTYTPIVLVGAPSTMNTILGNTFDNFRVSGTAIVLGTSATNNIVSLNVTGTVGAPATAVQVDSDAGANNILIGNASALNDGVVDLSVGPQTIIRNLGSLNITSGKLLSVLNSMTLSATDGATVNAGAGGTILYTTGNGGGLTGLSTSQLSDYAEGTWTPTIVGSSVAGSQTYTNQWGRYIRVGNMVTAWFRVGISVKDVAATGNVQFGGLPFAATSAVPSEIYAGAVRSINAIAHGAGYLQFGVSLQPGASSIDLYEFGQTAGGNAQAVPVSALMSGGTSAIVGTITYPIGP